VKQPDAKTVVAGLKKEASQWCDVGIMKGTTCVVSYYHLTSDVAQGNGGEVSVIGSWLFSLAVTLAGLLFIAIASTEADYEARPNVQS